MATEVKLPRLGQGMESGTIVKWLKSEGEPVSKREPLYELDTDKVTQEVEAEADGVLLKIVVAEGEVEVGRTVAFIGAEGETVSVSDAVAPETDRRETTSDGNGRGAVEEQRPSEPAQTAPVAPIHAAEGRVKASPLARRIAREKGVDLERVQGTGPDGRIIAEDVEKASAAPPAAAPAPAFEPVGEIEEIQLTSTRKTIARRLTEAWQAPVFQLQVTADMTSVLAVREALVERLREGETKPTVNDVLTKLVARALVRHPAVNAQFLGDRIVRFPSANVGIAVAAPSGLIVPVVRDADRRTIGEIAAARADLVGRAREGKLRLEDLEDGTFTISNLGMFGIDRFTAVLNPPQAAILAVGQVAEQPVVEDGQLVVRPVAHLTLTCDHRAIDGADGAEFLQTLKELLRLPGLAL
jgi:pyruvate dehydrogenase E2 component (dihydrolipoyllysine-residue acetyltransferase)